MNYNLKLDNNKGYKWIKFKSLHIRGVLFNEKGEILDISDIYQRIKDSTDINSFSVKVSELNGIFNIILVKDDQILIGTDITRSLPLFLEKIGETWRLMDRISLEEGPLKSLRKKSLEEFKGTGFVIGNKTILEGITQLESAEVVELKKDSIVRKFYWDYTTSKYSEKSFEELQISLKNIYNNLIQRIISGANGKNIVIPLSGGYDSRLIACLIKSSGYKNVICYTYGRKECFEAKISEKIAKKLGFKWIFIEYNKTNIKSAIQESGLWNQFVEYSFNFVSIPHISDFIAVSELKKLDLIPKDSIFLPGHSGDFFAGTHIPPDVDNILTYDQVKAYLERKHFRYKTAKNVELDSLKYSGKIHSIIEDFSRSERQAKFIINSVRVYEFFGYEFLLPFWDRELTDFFKNVDKVYKNRSSYIKYIPKLNLYDSVSKEIFYDFGVDIKKSFFHNFLARLLCKIFGICKKKDCLNFHLMKGALNGYYNSSDHINKAVIGDTLIRLGFDNK